MPEQPTRPLPIERVGDVQSHYNRADDDGKPGLNAWLHAEIEKDRFIETIDEQGVIKPGDVEGIAFWQDITRIMKPIAIIESPRYVSHDDRMASYRQERIDRVMTNIKGSEVIAQVLEESRNFTDEELIGITEAHFAAVEMFLTTGDRRRSFWPEQMTFALDQVGDWDQAKDLDTLAVVAHELDRRKEQPEYLKRVNIVARNIGLLHAAHGNIGRAIGLLAAMEDVDLARPLIDSIAEKMLSDKEKYGEEYYQRDYRYAQIMLRGRETLATFSELLQPATVPVIEGARRWFETFGTTSIMFETWIDEDTITAVTSQGTSVELPYTCFNIRGVHNRGTKLEHAMSETEKGVKYAALDDELRTLIDSKLDELNNPAVNQLIDTRIDQEPLERLVFGFGFTLKTMDVSEGEWKLMPGFDPKRIIEDEYDNGDVKDIEEVEGPGWLITEYEGSYLNMEGFTQKDILRIAPNEANTFWLAGNPRIVTSSEHSHNEEGKQVVITPIRFYKVSKAI